MDGPTARAYLGHQIRKLHEDEDALGRGEREHLVDHRAQLAPERTAHALRLAVQLGRAHDRRVAHRGRAPWRGALLPLRERVQPRRRANVAAAREHGGVGDAHARQPCRRERFERVCRLGRLEIAHTLEEAQRAPAADVLLVQRAQLVHLRGDGSR